MTIWRKPALVAMLLAIAAILALIPMGRAEAIVYYFNDSGDACDGTSKAAGHVTTLVGTTGCTTPNGVTARVTGSDLYMVTGYLQGGYSIPRVITGGTGSSIGVQNPGAAGTGLIHLIEADSSTGSVIQVLDSATFTLTSGSSSKMTDLSALTGTVGAGNSVGFAVVIQNVSNRNMYTYWGGTYNNAAQSQWVSITEGYTGDGIQMSSAGTSGTSADQGSNTVMQYFKLAEVNHVAGSPVVDKIRVDGMGTDPDYNVYGVSIYLSSNTTLELGTDTFLGSGTFSNETVTIDITDQTLSTTPSNYFLIVYNVYLDARTSDTLQSTLANQTYIIPLSAGDYVEPFTNVSSGTMSISAVAKDRVELNDSEVWSSGYLERGVVNAPIFSMSLHVIESGDDGVGTLTSFKVDNIGSVPASDITAVKAWMSSDENLDISTDTKIHTAASYTFNPVTNSVTMLANYNAFVNTITATKKYLFITYDISASADTTKWLEAEVVNEKYVTLDLNSKAVVNSFYGFQSNSLPIRQANFKTIGECYECHTFPPLDSPDPATKKRNPYSGAVVGDHERISHVGGTTEADCAVCHDVPNGNLNHQDGWLSMNSTIGAQGNYNKPSLQHVNNGTTDVCYNTVCHGDLEYSPQWGIGTIHCIDCHSENQPDPSTGPRRSTFVDMQTSSSHHIYNTTAIADSTCEVCHLRSNHTREGDPEVRLLNGDTGAAVIFDGTGASAEEACVSCHDADGVSRLGQNAIKPFYASGDMKNVPDIGWKNGQSAHDLAANIATDKCLACHGNSGGSSTNTLNPTISAHGSDEEMMLRYAYDSATPETYCLTSNCHGALGTVDVGTAFSALSNHTKGKQNCLLCHDPHRAESGLHVPGLPTVQVGNVAIMEGRTAEYQICFDADQGTCHNAARVMSGTSSGSYANTNFGGGTALYPSLWKSMPNIQAQFSTTNLAYHPLLAPGRNQPAGTENSNWTSSSLRKSDVSAAGLDHTFVDGWGQSSLVTCTDCHDNSGVGHSGARGPHGSSRPWILRSVDNTQNIKVTTAGGTVYLNTNLTTATAQIARNLCINCHRKDVYGDGDAVGGSGNVLSRYDHAPNGSCVTTGSGPMVSTGCFNCHGGGEVVGIHGTSKPAGTTVGGGSDALGKRFMNGAAWPSHVLGDTSGSLVCYTGSGGTVQGVSISTCSKHSSTGGKTDTPNYYYSWQ